MVINVVRYFKWFPDKVHSFFLDEIDYFGLEFWDNQVKQISQEIQEKAKTKAP